MSSIAVSGCITTNSQGFLKGGVGGHSGPLSEFCCLPGFCAIINMANVFNPNIYEKCIM